MVTYIGLLQHKIWSSFEHFVFVFQVCEHYCEETLGPKGKIYFPLSFLVVLYPSMQSLLHWPYPHKFAYYSISRHVIPVHL